MKRNLVRTVALTLAIAFILSMVSTTQVKQANAAGWSANSWTVPLIDNWGKLLGKAEAKGYLYNSTQPPDWTTKHPGVTWSWANWVLLSTSTDVFVNDTGSYITFSHIPPSWNNTYGTITYTLVIKQEISGSVTPITIYNATVMTLDPTIIGGTGFDPYSEAFTKKDLGSILQFGYEAGNGHIVDPVTPIVDSLSQPIRVWLYYVALQVVDEMGLPLTVTDVKVFYTSNWLKNGTWITTSSVSGVVLGKYEEATANGTYDPPTNGLIPVQNPFGYIAEPLVGWVVLRLPLIDGLSQYLNTSGYTGTWPVGQNRSLVNNMTFLFYYHGTLVGNFSATNLTAPALGEVAWIASGAINAEVNTKFESVLALPGFPVTPVVLQGNHSYQAVVNVAWINFSLWDQAGAPWPTRNAKITLYDNDIDKQYPWPGVIDPDWSGGPSIVMLRYPVVNHTLKIVTTWFDCTVNVSYVYANDAFDGGFDMDTINGVNRYQGGLIVDMVRVWIKVFTSTQVPAPLDPNWVDEVKIRIESRSAPQTTYIAKLSYWHGYIILPDTPFGWWLSGGIGAAEEEFAVGWLPNGTWTTTDFFVKYKGLEVVNTVTRYPVNRTLLLNCTPALLRAETGDYDKTFILYAGVYDIGFQVLLGSSHSNVTAPEGTPLFVTTPDMQRILLTTDGMGSVTLRDVPTGIYKDFVILYKMMPINCSNVKLAYVNASTKPLIKLLFPAFYVNITVWNFEGTFKLINLNASLYNTVDYSKYGITNDLLRRALDVARKRSVVLPDDWATITPVAVTSPDITDLIDYLGSHPMSYSTIMYRTQLWVTGRDADGNQGPDGTPVWPMQLGLMPAANYSVRISVPNGTDKAIQAGFRPADYNATVYWSGDPYPGVGPIEVDASKAVDQTVSVNIYTYIYNVQVQTLDASGQPLKLADMSAVILAEPYDLVLGTDGNLKAAGYNDLDTPWQLWYMQQYDENATLGAPPYYNAYLVRFNSSDSNWFHSVNATCVSPPTDPDLGTSAHAYPNQSRYLIGMSTLEATIDNYTFNVYYQGVLVFNDSIPLTNPYTIGTAGHSVTGTHKIKTSVYPYTFEATNDPLDGTTFGIANLNVKVYWAGLNTTWWPTVNLTYRTAPEEFALLNATKLYKGFNTTVVERMWGNVTGIETKESIVTTANAPYYSSFVKIVNGTTDSNGEFKAMVPVWNYSVGIFPSFMGTLFEDDFNSTVGWITNPWLGDVGSRTLTYNVTPSSALNPALGDDYDFPFDTTIGGPRRPIMANDVMNLVWRTESIFGTPVFVNYTTIPGKTNNVPAVDEARLVGVAPGYEPWVNYASMNATGLINPKKGDIGGVSLTMNTRDGIRFYGIGVLLNNNNTKLIYGDFQGRSPELALIGTGPYKKEGSKIAPPQPVSNFFAKADSATMANDLWVTVQDYNGNNLSYQRVEVFREETIITLDNGSLKVLPPELWTVQYTPRDPPYSYIKIASTPTAILWGMYNVCVRTTNLTDVVVDDTNLVVPGKDNAAQEVRNLELYGIQWKGLELMGGSIDWTSDKYIIRWPAKLDVQIKAGDGSTPIAKAWVYLLYGTNWAHGGGLTDEVMYDVYTPPLNLSRVGRMNWPQDLILLPSGAISWGYWEIGQNVTAALTDGVGYAGSLYVGPGRAEGALATSDTTTLNLGFNVYADVYTVKVYYMYKGSTKIYGPVEGSVVWDTFTDQPQHRYIYLGIPPPDTATGEDFSNAQHKIFPTRIWNLKITIVDQSAAARPIAGASVTIPGLGTVTTASDGSVPFNLAPSGTYSLSAKWMSKFNTEEVTIVKSTIPLQTTMDQIIPATVYDAELQLVSPSGKPISGAMMSLANVSLGMTGADGKVVASQVPGKYTEAGTTAYPVTAMWLGVDVSPGPVVVTASRTYILTASNIATLTVQVVGAQGQGLNAAQVDIKNSAGTTVFSGVANEQGVASVEVPYGTYSIHTEYKGFSSDQSTTVNSANPSPVSMASSVFIEIFGQAMTFATFVLWIIVIIIVVLVLAIVIHEYHVWRRKRLPQLFGAPRVPGA